MANCSDVFGKMTLEGEWTPSMITNLNIIIGEWRIWYFNIKMDVFKPVTREVRFTANGYWSFDVNLGKIAEWTLNTDNEFVRAAYIGLCSEMITRTDEFGVSDSKIVVEFIEEEGGCRLLREACAEIICTAGKGLRGITINSENYEYTKENIVKLGFCSSEDDVKWQ